MTERVLGRPGAAPRLAPERAFPPLPRTAPALRPGAEAKPGIEARPAAVARQAAARRPVHVAVAVGVSAGLYAASLAGVTALQAGSDAGLAAERAPAAAARPARRGSHDAAEAAAARIEASYANASSAYQAVADGIALHEASLGELGKQVKAVEGSASSLRVPTYSSLPAVSSRTVYVSQKPATNACTTGSGKPC